MNKFVYCLMGIVCVFSTQAHAEELTKSLKVCASYSDSLKRLVCFDKIVADMVEQKPTVENKAQKSIQTVKTEVAPKQVVVSEPVEEPTFDAEEAFGAERKYIKKEQVTEVTLVIASVSKTLRGKLSLIFENGQVWEQKDTDKHAKFEAGETVIIKRGVFDAFYMKKPDANRTIRVKRIK